MEMAGADRDVVIDAGDNSLLAAWGVGARPASVTTDLPLAIASSPCGLLARTWPSKKTISVRSASTRTRNSVPSAAASTNGISTVSRRGWRAEEAGRAIQQLDHQRLVAAVGDAQRCVLLAPHVRLVDDRHLGAAAVADVDDIAGTELFVQRSPAPDAEFYY